MSQVKIDTVYRVLSKNDKTKIEDLLASRRNLGTIGVNWTAESIMKGVAGGTLSLALTYPNGSQIDAIVLFKIMDTILEIFLIYSRKGATGAGENLFRNLIAAHGQTVEVWLEVHEDNKAAVAFYERIGFNQVSTRQGYYPDGKRAINYSLSVAVGDQLG